MHVDKQTIVKRLRQRRAAPLPWGTELPDQFQHAEHRGPLGNFGIGDVDKIVGKLPSAS